MVPWQVALGGLILGMGYAGTMALFAPGPMPAIVAIPLVIIGVAFSMYGLGRKKGV